MSGRLRPLLPLKLTWSSWQCCSPAWHCGETTDGILLQPPAWSEWKVCALTLDLGYSPQAFWGLGRLVTLLLWGATAAGAWQSKILSHRRFLWTSWGKPTCPPTWRVATHGRLGRWWKRVNKLETVSQDQSHIKQAFRISLKKHDPINSIDALSCPDIPSGSMSWPVCDRRLLGHTIILSLSKNLLCLKMTLLLHWMTHDTCLLGPN